LPGAFSIPIHGNEALNVDLLRHLLKLAHLRDFDT